MAGRDEVVSDCASSILVALTITVMATLYVILPDIPWWSPVVGAWIGAGLHLARLFLHACREASR